MKVGDVVRISGNCAFAGAERWIGRLGIVKHIDRNGISFPVTVRMLDSGEEVPVMYKEVELPETDPDLT